MNMGFDIWQEYIFYDCFSGHMQKIRPKSQDLSEISGFQKILKLRFCITLTSKNCYNSLDFEDTGLKFCMQA